MVTSRVLLTHLIGTGMAEAVMPYMALFHAVEGAKMSAARIDELLNTPILTERSAPKIAKANDIVFEHVGCVIQIVKTRRLRILVLLLKRRLRRL